MTLLLTADKHIQYEYDKLNDKYQLVSHKTTEFVSTMDKIHKNLISRYDKNEIIKDGLFKASKECSSNIFQSISRSIQCLLVQQEKFYQVIQQKQAIKSSQESQIKPKSKKKKKNKSIQKQQNTENNGNEDDDIEILNNNHSKKQIEPIQNESLSITTNNHKRKRRQSSQEEDENKLEIVDNLENNQPSKKRKIMENRTDTNQSNINSQSKRKKLKHRNKNNSKKLKSRRYGMGHPSSWSKELRRKLNETDSSPSIMDNDDSESDNDKEDADDLLKTITDGTKRLETLKQNMDDSMQKIKTLNDI